MSSLFDDEYSVDVDDVHGFENFLSEVINAGHLDGKALGITKQVIEKGQDSLSDKQEYVFKKEVVREFISMKCGRCGNGIPWSEMYAASGNGGFCGYCAHMMSKDD